MHPRVDARAVPSSPRYWSVEIEGRGLYWFRFPTYSLLYALMEFSTHLDEVGRLGQSLELAGLVIGVSWWHRGLDLDVEPPTTRATTAELSAYSARVIDELQEHGLSVHEILALHWAAMPRVLEWSRDVVRSSKAAAAAPAEVAPEDRPADPTSPPGGGPT